LTQAPPPPQDDVTGLLVRISEGSRSAVDALMPIVYDQLRALAQGYLASERPGHTLQATALVHESFLKLVDQRDVEWKNRAHFHAIAAQAMRRILVDHARTKKRAKRGGGGGAQPIDERVLIGDDAAVDVLELEDALRRLAGLHERQAQIVEMRFFGGMESKAIAELLGVSPATVSADWSMARAWLRAELRGDVS